MAVEMTDITNDFDCGNYQNLVKNDTNDFVLEPIKVDYQPNGTFWWGLKIQNSAYHDQTVSFTIDNLDINNFMEVYPPQPVYSYDGSNWTRISGAIYDDTTKQLSFGITFPASGTEVIIHPNPPLTYTAMNNWVAGLSSNYHKTENLGTIDSKNLFLLTITDSNGSVRSKKNIWIFGGVHPGEVWGAWAVKGLVDFLLGSSETAATMRRNYVWKILPMVNPDGVHQGRGYYNSEGYNIFEDFNNENTTNVQMIKAAVDAWCWKPDMVIDCHCVIGAPVPYNKLHINDKANGKTDYHMRQTGVRLANILIYRTQMAGTADINRSSNNASLINYFINMKGCQRALVMEFCLVDPETTIEKIMGQGRQIALAVNDYFAGQSGHFNKWV
jgi:hypothetical protein